VYYALAEAGRIIAPVPVLDRSAQIVRKGGLCMLHVDDDPDKADDPFARFNEIDYVQADARGWLVDDTLEVERLLSGQTLMGRTPTAWLSQAIEPHEWSCVILEPIRLRIRPNEHVISGGRATGVLA